MSVGIYINFKGNCREAVEFYAKVFKTHEPKFMTFGDVPPNPEFPHSEETKNLILHTQLEINGTTIMFSDVPPGLPFIAGNNITLVITSKKIDEIKSLFEQLKEGAHIDMDLQETFWSKCYGNLRDKYGIGWQLSYSGD